MTIRIDYSTLDPSRLEDWATPLGSLLLAAGDCLRSGGDKCRQESIEGLKEFIEWSPFQSLDEIAAETVQDLMSAAIDSALRSIGQRTARLQHLTKDIRRAAFGARKSAASVRMEAVSGVLDATTGTIRALTHLRDAIKENADVAELMGKVEELVTKTQALRNELERVPVGGSPDAG